MIIHKTFTNIPDLWDLDQVVKDLFAVSTCNRVLILVALQSKHSGEDVGVISQARFKCAQAAWLWLEDNFESEGADSAWVGCMSA